MPATRIDTRKGWVGDRRGALLEAVQRALVVGLKIPEDDRCIVLSEHDAEAMLVPPTKGAEYLVIEIRLFSGRSLEAKRRLYAALVEELAAFGVARSDVKVILVEVPQENWGLGGRPANEIDLGFKVDV
ncbi:tautomerase family protein [Oryzibacter oryziterrae]|uniref:tautomerase family protein n=1 Tax=Oryzibacter oryziterrae TaxID=2766474 RepID=UPI001F18913F|nr:tautomerase family protein [Oryzibacter oryziterrae]